MQLESLSVRNGKEHLVERILLETTGGCVAARTMNPRLFAPDHESLRAFSSRENLLTVGEEC